MDYDEENSLLDDSGFNPNTDTGLEDEHLYDDPGDEPIDENDGFRFGEEEESSDSL